MLTRRAALLAAPRLGLPARGFAQGGAAAAGLPDRPLRMPVGFVAGGLTDVTARARSTTPPPAMAACCT